MPMLLLWRKRDGVPPADFITSFMPRSALGLEAGSCWTAEFITGTQAPAGEGGHVSIDYRGPRCGCGKLGCIEALAAGPAIGCVGRAPSWRPDTLAPRFSISPEGDVTAVTSEMVGQAYADGDSLAREILQETVEIADSVDRQHH